MGLPRKSVPRVGTMLSGRNLTRGFASVGLPFVTLLRLREELQAGNERARLATRR